MSGSLGCRSARDNQIDLLERELRTQEDYIYELEDYVLEYSEKLRHVRSVQPYEIVTQSKPLEPVLEPARPVEEPHAEEPLGQLPVPETEPEPDDPEEHLPEDFSPEDIDIPELDLETPDPVGQREELRDDLQLEAAFESEDESIFFQDDAVEFASAIDETANDESLHVEPLHDEPIHEGYASEAEFLEKLFEDESPGLGYRQVERLVIIDVYRGDESNEPPTSLLTVIEARDTNDEPVDLDGKVSLMIMTTDPVAPQRLMRWDFNAEETASAWQSSQLGDGLHLELPLEDVIEAEEPLELWVRLVGTDGRKLLAQLPLRWEQLISVEAAMETQPMTDDDQLAEDGALPLPQQELAQVQPRGRDQATAGKKKSSKSEPQWRASLHQARRNAKGYASTAKGWASQPKGGREPLARLATAGQSSTTVRQATAPPDKKPAWTAGRNLRRSATSQEERPQWAPP